MSHTLPKAVRSPVLNKATARKLFEDECLAVFNPRGPEYGLDNDDAPADGSNLASISAIQRGRLAEAIIQYLSPTHGTNWCATTVDSIVALNLPADACDRFRRSVDDVTTTIKYHLGHGAVYPHAMVTMFATAIQTQAHDKWRAVASEGYRNLLAYVETHISHFLKPPSEEGRSQFASARAQVRNLASDLSPGGSKAAPPST